MATESIHFHQEVMGTFEPAKKPTTEEMRDLAEYLIELQKKKLLEEMQNRKKISDKPAPTLPEICRANIDAGHNTEGDWAAYIDACLDRQMETGIPTPVLMDSFECAAGWGAMAVRAGGELGLWKQEPWKITDEVYGNDYYLLPSEDASGCKLVVNGWVSNKIIQRTKRFATAKEAKNYLLFRMTEFAHAELKKSIIAQG